MRAFAWSGPVVLLLTLVARSAAAQVIPPPDDPDFGKSQRPWQLAPPGVSAEPQAPPSAPPPPPATTELRWYGYQVALADFGGIMLVSTQPVAGAGVLMVGGPTVHMLHRRPGAVAASLALRVAVPVAAYKLAGTCEGEQCMGNAMVAVAAFVAGVVVDITVVSWKEVPVKPTVAKPLQVVPTLALSPRGGLAGLAGTF